MKYIEQLNSYHRAQGLAGDELDSAVREDVARVHENIKMEGGDPHSFIEANDELDCLFYWVKTKEGHDFWAARSES